MSESLSKEAIERVRKVNSFKRLLDKFPELFKLAYYPGANLVLLRKEINGEWKGVDQTGSWFDDNWNMKMN